MYFEILDIVYYVYSGESMKETLNTKVKKYLYKNIRSALLMYIRYRK